MKLTLLLLSLFTYTALGQTYEADPKRTVKVYGEIGNQMLLKAQELQSLSIQSLEPITIVVNSPGGSVFLGDIFITAMRQVQGLGVKLHCVSPVLAASMGFNILTFCDKVYVFELTKLLYHPVRIPYLKDVTAKDALEIYTKLNKVDQRFKQRFYKVSRMDPTLIETTYYQEILWTGGELYQHVPNFLTIITTLKGVHNPFQLEDDTQNAVLETDIDEAESIKDI